MLGVDSCAMGSYYAWYIFQAAIGTHFKVLFFCFYLLGADSKQTLGVD